MGKKIMTYSVFETAKNEIPTQDKIDYFEKVLKETQEGKDFSKWFDVKSVRTGRFYVTKKNEIKGVNIPSKSYFNHFEREGSDLGKWFYEFLSSNGAYGDKSGDLKNLFREFMIDSVRKSRPSSISQKQIEGFFSKEDNAPVGDFPLPQSIYDKILNESGLITNFGFLYNLDFVKKCEEVGIQSRKSELRPDSFCIGLFADKIAESILGHEKLEGLKDLTKSFDSINNGRSNLHFKFMDKSSSDFIMSPKSDKGKSLRKGNHDTILKIGTDDKNLVIESLEKYVKNSLEKHNFGIGDQYSRIYSDPNSRSIKKVNEYLMSQLFGEGSVTKKEAEEAIEKSIVEEIGPHFDKNPLDLYILDGLPEFKKIIMDKYEIPDISKFGKTFKGGWMGES